MGSFTGITATVARVLHNCTKNFELNFLSEVAVCYIVKKQNTVDILSPISSRVIF